MSAFNSHVKQMREKWVILKKSFPKGNFRLSVPPTAGDGHLVSKTANTTIRMNLTKVTCDIVK